MSPAIFQQPEALSVCLSAHGVHPQFFGFGDAEGRF
jgi:hypothetical protein